MMAYEPQEGKGSFAKNKYKKTDNQPDIKGTFKWKGEVLEIAAWRKEREDGSIWYSCKVSEKREAPAKDEPRAQAPAKPKVDIDEDSIPF